MGLFTNIILFTGCLAAASIKTAPLAGKSSSAVAAIGTMAGPVGVAAIATVCGVVVLWNSVQMFEAVSRQNNAPPTRRTERPKQNSSSTKQEQPNKGSQQKQNSNKDAKRNNKRENSDRRDDLESAECEITSILDHIIGRLMRSIRLAGILQRISEVTGIPRNEIIQGGPSRFQDRHSGQGRDIHAAHVVRVGDIDARLTDYPHLYRELRNFIGHTQNVPRIINIGRVGRRIDGIQSAALAELANIDFSVSSLNINDIDILLDYINEYIDCITDYLKVTDSAPEHMFIKELERALQKLKDLKMNPKVLHIKGREGYEGKHTESYQ